MGRFEAMRRPELADLMLLATVTLWALNFTVTKYVISNGFAAGRVRRAALRRRRLSSSPRSPGGASARSRWSRRDLAMLAGAALIGIFLNQLSFVYAIKLTTATTVALLFGTLPVMTGIFARAARDRAAQLPLLDGGGARVQRCRAGRARLRRPACPASSGATCSASSASATWAWYTVAVSPLLQRYSTLRVSAVAFTIGTIPLLLVGAPQLARQDYHLPATIWLLLAFAIVGPLVVANLLWFGGISRVGPSRASVFANAQPFLAAIFSLLILCEPLGRLQVVGGFLIACAILISRIPTRTRAEVVTT